MSEEEIKQMKTEQVKIICPECCDIQDAVVEDAWPFPIYVHTCTSCNYIIMESEWESIQPNQ